MRDKLRQRLRRENFLPTWLGICSNPFFIMRRGIYRAVCELAPKVQGDILDFGCGSKPYEPLFTSARTYLGIDIHMSGHDHGNSRVDVYYDGSSIPFDDGQFDAVVSFEVFEHVFNLPQILAEIRRVTRDDGLLLISIPFGWDEHEVPFDCARYTSFGISDLLTKNGYDVLTLLKTTTYVQTLGQLLIMYLLHVLPWRGVGRVVVQLLLVLPCTIAVHLANLLLPRRYEFFSNSVVLARKHTAGEKNSP